MSAFIVDGDVMNRIAEYLEGKSETPKGSASAQQIGAELYQMNKDAVTYRYPQCSEDDLPGFDLRGWSWEAAEPATDEQTYKYIQCLLYQCSEGDVPETPLYEWLTEEGRDLAEIIVRNTEAYQAAKWG